MKNYMFLVLIFLLTSISAQNENNYEILNNIQNKIDKAFIEVFITNKTSALDTIYNKISEVDENSSNLDYYCRYWKSYINYKTSIFYLKEGEVELSKKHINIAISLIDQIENKDSEIYALLSLEQSYNFQFIPRQEFIVYMNKVNDNLEKTLIIGTNNLRAYYVNGSYDYYTPKEFGGGKKCESYLIKAISLPEKSLNSSFAPYWGKELAYDLLIKFYIREKNKEKAQIYYNEAVKLFPNSLLIKKNKENIN